VHAQEPVDDQLVSAAETTSSEKMEFVQRGVSEVQQAQADAEGLLSDAMKDESEERTQCVQNKLAAIRALYVVTQRASSTMGAALGAQDTDRAEHQFRQVVVALSKVRQFMAEAEACVGQAGITQGRTQIEVAEQGISSSDDTEVGPDVDGLIGQDPPNSSPFE